MKVVTNSACIIGALEEADNRWKWTNNDMNTKGSPVMNIRMKGIVENVPKDM